MYNKMLLFKIIRYNNNYNYNIKKQLNKLIVQIQKIQLKAVKIKENNNKYK